MYLETAQWSKLVALLGKARDGGALLDLLTVLRETGCRPKEARIVEARHIDGHRWVFDVLESKGKKRRRVVKLTDTAFTICQRLALKYPEGPLFRNRNGKPWSHRAVDYRLWRLSRKLGFSVTAYSLRHSWATDAIGRGASLAAIAFFMGHQGTKMLETVYSHVDRKDEFLDSEFKKAIGG